MTTDPQPALRACVGLGANLGDRAGALHAALDALRAAPGVTLLGVSAFHETDAVTLPGAPAQPNYLNAAALIETTLDARTLLDLLLSIERSLGRDRSGAERWAPRAIDLDLLLCADEVIDRPGLRVPHPRMHERRFVLAPLAEIAPDWRHPELGRTVQQLLAALDRTKPGRAGLVAALACALGLGSASGAFAAQPAPEGEQAIEQPGALPATPFEALERMQAAYLAGPIGENIELIARSSGQVRLERLTLRMGPGALRVDLDGLIAQATADGLAIANASSGRAFITPGAPGEGRFALVARALPPLPLPQLAVARDGPAPESIAPLCRELRWFSATPMGGLLLVEGVGPECSASLALDRATWRLSSATLRGRSSNGPMSVEIRVEPFDPGDASAWTLDHGALTPVASIAGLAPRQGEVRVGAACPDLLLLTRDATPWRLSDEISGDAPPLALLLFRDEAPGVRDAAEAARLAGVRLIAGVTLPASGVEPLARLADLAARWEGDLLWTVSIETTLGRFAPDSLGVLVIVDAGGVVRLVEPIENRAGDAQSLARRIVEAIGSE